MASAPWRARARFSIDRGGTFTDVYYTWTARDGTPREGVMKLLSEDPRHYDSAPREGIRRALEAITGDAHPREQPVPYAHIESIRMATTVATNALLERAGARMALLVTRGFRDLLHIGTQARPAIFDLRVAKPGSLYEDVLEVEERVVPFREGEELPAHAGAAVVEGTTGERFVVEQAPDLGALEPQLRALRSRGVTSLAVALMHAYALPAHELAVGQLARACGFAHVSLSHEVMPMVKIVLRGFTAAADAYLTPHIRRYIADFKRGFVGGLEAGAGGCSAPPPRLSFMQSDGGLTPVEAFSGHKAVLSGPAGGVVGYALTTWDARTRQPIVALDVGGTSSDVSRFAGAFEHVLEATVAGVPIQAPQLDISTVAAGGGSRLFFRSGLMAVGPESAGAHPGPTCYRKGGPLAVTDANLQLGRIVPRHFPACFGPREDEPLDADATAAAFAALAADVNAHYAAEAAGGGSSGGAAPSPKSADELAAGYVAIANEAMCRPIRALTQMRGHDVTTHVLAIFGGAGPQHACAIARALGISRVFISRYAGILSAYGLSLADVVAEAQAPLAVALVTPQQPQQQQQSLAELAAAVAVAGTAVGVVAAESAPLVAAAATPAATGVSESAAALTRALLDAAPDALAPATVALVAGRLQGLAAQVGGKLTAQGFDPACVRVELLLNLRYAGTDAAIMTPCIDGGSEEPQLRGADGGGDGNGDGMTGTLHAIPLSALLADDGAGLALIARAVARAPSHFVRSYFSEFGFVVRGREVLVDDVRVRGIAHSPAAPRVPVRSVPPGTLAVPLDTQSVYYDGVGRVPTPLFAMTSLTHGHSINGPALLLDATATIVVEPGFSAAITPLGDVELTVTAAPLPATAGSADDGSGSSSEAAHCPAAAPPSPLPPLPAPAEAPAKVRAEAPTAAAAAATSASSNSSSAQGGSLAYDASRGEAVPCDPIRLSIFGHRFMSIAEQMGRTLQRTSISVNMRERLDYSCALFGPDGGLVANAPHIPVHLGAMQDAVRFQLQHWRDDLADGDVLVSNHPQLAGGSHLPDITVITPVFEEEESAAGAGARSRIVFFVAARGHHADIGGIAPGSMPPHSQSLDEEGAQIVAHKLVSRGVFDEAGIRAIMAAPGLRGIPGCSGSRNLRDVLSDLRAQVAANTHGIRLVRGLIREYGLRTVHAYMGHIQAAAEGAVRSMLAEFSLARGLPPTGGTVSALDFMDDGTPIALAITIDRVARTAVFDFSGTGPQVLGNTNAPRAVAYSAILYCLRCLVDADVPLNQGCLAPVRIVIPPGCLLHPDPTAAVVGGNVLTSQRVVDVILAAFGACAASQGCMNNTTFGNADFGYYETVCGGAGAGPSWAGTAGVHTHMTNTRITDPEILERRYPVVLRAFTLRRGSGGGGAQPGGDGVLRELQFRQRVMASVLSERRAFQPPGAAGGRPGARGLNSLLRADGRVVSLGGKASVAVQPGDRLRIETPGGGGWGAPPGAGSSGGGDGGGTGGAVDAKGVVAGFLFTGSVGRYKETQESA